MNKMSLEERALRHADKFFTDEHMWWRGGAHAHPTIGSTCVGLLLNKYRRNAQEYGLPGDANFKWASEVMDVPHVTKWNDALPSFKAMKSALKARIKYYKDMRR